MEGCKPTSHVTEEHIWFLPYQVLGTISGQEWNAEDQRLQRALGAFEAKAAVKALPVRLAGPPVRDERSHKRRCVCVIPQQMEELEWPRC